MKKYSTISRKIQNNLTLLVLIFFIIMISVISTKFTKEIQWWFDKASENKIVDVSHHITELVAYYDFASIEDILKLEVDETSELNYLQFNYGADLKEEVSFGEKDKEPLTEHIKEIRINNEKFGLLISQFDNSVLNKKKNQFILTILFGWLLFLITFFFLLKKLLSKLLTRPITNLKKNIIEVTKGNLNIELDYKSNDEVGDLTDSFKIMMKDLSEKDEYTSSILNSTQAGVALINAETHVIEYVNPVAIEMIGIEKDEIVGHLCHKFICPAQEGECPISDKGLAVDNSEKVLLTAKGEELSILKTVKQISIGNKNLLIETFIDISDMKQLQEQISTNEKKYHTMFKDSPAAIIMTDSDGFIVDINERVKEWLGYETKPIIGTRILELPFLTKQSRRKIVEEFKKRTSGHDRSDYELNFISKNGEEHIGSVLVNALRDDQQKIVGEIITILDITKEKNANALMLNNEKKFKELFENSNDAIFIHNIDDEKILEVNKRAEEITGYSRDELLTMTAIDLSAEKTSNKENSLIKNDTLQIETTFQKKDGTIIWVDISARVIDRNENVAQGVVRDITEEKNTQQLIKNQENKFRTMFNTVSDAIYLMKDNKIVDCNSATVKLYGMKSKEEFLNTNPKDLSPTNQPDGSNSLSKSIKALRKTINEGYSHLEWVIKTKEGKEITTDLTTALIETNHQNFIHVSLRDITKRKQMDIELIKMRNEMEQILDASIPICAIDLNYNILRVNNSFCNLVDVKNADNIIGKRCYDIINFGLCNTEKCLLKRALAGGKNINAEVKCNFNNGKITDCSINAKPYNDQNGKLVGIVESINNITELKQSAQEIDIRNIKIEMNNWLISGQKKLNDEMQGNQEIKSLTSNIITFLAKYLHAQVGALYVTDDKREQLSISGTYAYPISKNKNCKFGEGLVGQAAVENELIILSDLPEDYITINSALGKTIPKNLIVSPFTLDGKVLGVIELGSINEFNDNELDFIKTAMKDIAIAINSSIARIKMRVLLDKTLQQSEELQSQQEELRASNEELEEQTEELKASSEQLKNQQEELQTTNTELEEKTESLQKQSTEIKKQNSKIENAKKEIEKKAEDLAIASKYKSEFLANMSHELRTPLNSLLILSKNLADNKKENLDTKQVESAEIIYNSGNDLLNLINEILDLSKVEAGKMTTNIESVEIEDIKANISRNFIHQTQKKGLELLFEIDDDIPEIIQTDRQRVEQIIKNLISNALKFTADGSITIAFHRPDNDTNFSISKLIPEKSVAISVIDTGIGIPKEKQVAIFEAFQQADGTTSRKFGGTGLGLSISKELSKLLGGELQLKSEEGIGSTFTCYLPEVTESKINPDEIPERRKSTDRRKHPTEKLKVLRKQKTTATQSISDDRKSIKKSDKTILVIEDDLNFAKTLKTICEERNFKFLHASDGESGLKLASEFIPDGIILDIGLPGIDGWEVLEILKASKDIRHIPVHIMSALDKTIDAFQKGAVGFLTKPVNSEQLGSAFERIDDFRDKKNKKMLIVEDNEILRKSVIQLLEDENVTIDDAKDGKSVIEKLHNIEYDCMILDLSLPDITGFDLLKMLKKDKKIKSIPPVIVYTGTDISKEEEFELRKYAKSIIIKGVKSEERLIDETALFLHQVVSELPEDKQKIISKLHDTDSLFIDKKILVVDDDMRNVFAVSAALEEKEMLITSAANGQKALDILKEDPEFDLILMDIMMPIMDGYETMGHIREDAKIKDIPIIALTAKAMKGDKEKCIEAGANDYLTKPLNIERLLSLMRIWMYK